MPQSAAAAFEAPRYAPPTAPAHAARPTSTPVGSLAAPPRSVAVFRALQLGDMLCAVPALRTLRRAWPQARITLVGLPWARDFARRYAHLVDDFLAFPGDPALPEREPEPQAWPAFLQAAAERDFDLTVQLHGDGSLTNALVERIPARQRAGFMPDTAEALFLRYPAQGAEARRLLQLATHLARHSGAAPAAEGAEAAHEAPDERLEFPLGAADAAEWSPYPAVRALLERGGYLCIHAGARAADKRWPPQHFARVADTLATATGMPVVLSGSEAERPLTRAVAAAMRTPAIDAALPVSAGALAALVGRARLLVCNDTGVSHIAAALRVPSVVVFMATDLERWAPLDAALHRRVWDPARNDVAGVLREAQALLAGGGTGR